MFNVRAIDHGGFQAIVTALSYESSLDDLQYIEQVLRELFEATGTQASFGICCVQTAYLGIGF